MSQIDTEKMQRAINGVFLSLAEPMNKLGVAIAELGQSFADAYLKAFEAITQRIHPIVKAYYELRLPGESITDYLERNPHKIDNPDIRWEYQVHIWTAPIRWWKAIFKRGD
jgi:hypothetical protein